jgi:hypothetical protein
VDARNCSAGHADARNGRITSQRLSQASSTNKRMATWRCRIHSHKHSGSSLLCTRHSWCAAARERHLDEAKSEFVTHLTTRLTRQARQSRHRISTLLRSCVYGAGQGCLRSNRLRATVDLSDNDNDSNEDLVAAGYKSRYVKQKVFFLWREATTLEQVQGVSRKSPTPASRLRTTSRKSSQVCSACT